MERVLDQRAHLDDPNAIGAAVIQYVRFLITAKHSKGPFEPSLLVDLVWHTHLQMAGRYWEDCARITGTIVDHIDDI